MKRAGYTLTEPAAGIFFVQGPASNWIILREAKRFTLVDGGYRGDLPLVLASIREAGLAPDDAVAVLITHAHVDHTGAAAHFAQHYGTPVLCSSGELNHLRGEEKFSVTPLQIVRRAWQPRVFRWAVHVLRSGGAAGHPAPSAAAWDDALLAGLPGSPVAVPTPGHTPGHTAFYLSRAKAVITGDALVTGHAISAWNGPQLLHPMFHHDGARVDSALAILSKLDACLLLPGHGPAVRTGIREAANTAWRQRATSVKAPRPVLLPGRKGGLAGEPTYGRVEHSGTAVPGAE
ncbi:MBL fold metallo-hydrolase [Arthrobacter sp. zg-Y750]|uniref:MBL fold metallo-hydrolase n=1 Tax=Arthrobacter sp. zg-Y750 TaxID=2894189 RepID=UPI002F4067C1|nr:MBL fold metallo-hydrolase [Arthrobacter sp. zg-Y750]